MSEAGRPMEYPIVIGFGGNVGTETEIAERFAEARLALGEYGELMAALLYRSAPIGPAQADYLNTAVRLRPMPRAAQLTPQALLSRLHAIENELGRRRADEQRFGPRPIDLDLLVWGARSERTPDLELPHPRLAQRRFALQPLIDVVGPDFEIAGVSAGELLARVADQRLETIGAW